MEIVDCICFAQPIYKKQKVSAISHFLPPGCGNNSHKMFVLEPEVDPAISNSSSSRVKRLPKTWEMSLKELSRVKAEAHILKFEFLKTSFPAENHKKT